MPKGIPKNGTNNGWLTTERLRGAKNPKWRGNKGSQNPNWKGGNSHQYRVKQAPRIKPEQCEICGAFGSDTKKGLCFDHDHKTGKFRGWICIRCNVALAMVKDSQELLSRLFEYLDKK